MESQVEILGKKLTTREKYSRPAKNTRDPRKILATCEKHPRPANKTRDPRTKPARRDPRQLDYLPESDALMNNS